MCCARQWQELRLYVGREENRPLRRDNVAERQGFEPWVGVNPQRFSRPPRSTTPAPLRRLGIVEKWRQPMRGINRIQVICFWEIDRSMLRLLRQDLCAVTRLYCRFKLSINPRNSALSLPLAPMTFPGVLDYSSEFCDSVSPDSSSSEVSGSVSSSSVSLSSGSDSSTRIASLLLACCSATATTRESWANGTLD